MGTTSGSTVAWPATFTRTIFEMEGVPASFRMNTM